jgi:Xaa-Pro aminopeptidase
MATTDRERALAELVPEREPYFPPDEYRQRVERIRREMESASIQTLFLSAPDSICYVDGYRSEWYQGQSPIDPAWYPASGIAINVDADQPVHYEDEDELILARMTTVGSELRAGRHDAGPLMDQIVEDLWGRGWLSGTIGLEMWAGRPSRGYSELFQAALESKGARVVDATNVTRKVRRIKSEREIACVREAQRIADIGMQAAITQLAPGVTELDVYAEMTYAMAKAGGEPASIMLPVASGGKSACVHALASRRRIQPGDVVNVDICGVYQRYHANMARTFSVGEPSKGVAERCGKAAGAVQVVARALRPGLPVRQLLAVLEEYYRAEGILEELWWVGGYELGISLPPDWVGGWFFDTWTDPGDAVFAAGLVTNLECNFYLPELAGVTMQINTLVFTDESAEVLYGIPPDLIVVGA